VGRIALGIDNASCAHCARVITCSLKRVDGVISVEVDPYGRQVIVDFDPARISVESIRSVLLSSGYPCRLPSASPQVARPRLRPGAAG